MSRAIFLNRRFTQTASYVRARQDIRRKIVGYCIFTAALIAQIISFMNSDFRKYLLEIQE